MNTTFLPIGEKADNGYQASIHLYLLDKNEDPARPMIVLCPGGAYSGVCENWEGERVALCYNTAGFHVAILDYAVATYFSGDGACRLHPMPVRQVAEAVRVCRAHAEEWQVDPQKIAVCGFSAGGHLAASLCTLWNDEQVFSAEEIASRAHRPDACVLSYPVITSGDKAHKRSIVNLLGTTDETDPLWDKMSLEKQVDKDTPPTFLWHTVPDKTVPVENSLLYAAALQEHGVPFEMHIFPDGDHGLSLATEGRLRTRSVFRREYNWMKLAIDWLSGVFHL